MTRRLANFMANPDPEEMKLAALRTAVEKIREKTYQPGHGMKSPPLVAIEQAGTELLALRGAARQQSQPQGVPAKRYFDGSED